MIRLVRCCQAIGRPDSGRTRFDTGPRTRAPTTRFVPTVSRSDCAEGLMGSATGLNHPDLGPRLLSPAGRPDVHGEIAVDPYLRRAERK